MAALEAMRNFTLSLLAEVREGAAGLILPEAQVRQDQVNPHILLSLRNNS